MNTSDYLLENSEDSRVALIEGTKAYTYRELKAAAARVAGELSGKAMRFGDRVGIVGGNSFFWVASYLAVLKMGFVAVPFSTTLTPENANRNAQWAECRVILMDRRHKRVFGPAFDSQIPIIDDGLLATPGPECWPNERDIHDETDAALMFTSGTTALPKAVRITHANIQANTDSIIEYLSLVRDDRMLVILPFFYCFGTSLLHTHLRVGGSLAICNNFTFPESALNMMENLECTGFAGVPSSYQLLLRISSFKERTMPKLRLMQQAGGKLHSVLIKELLDSKPGVEVFVMYGQTEATARLSYLPPAKIQSKLGSIGKGIPGVTLRVLDESGMPVKPGEVGEIFARGRNISPGYLNDPESTASKFINGELRTGDLATVDDEGYIFVVDRKDDFIKSWGYRVSSQEVESCVLGIDEIVSAAAVGIPNLAAGESIHVFITIRPDSKVLPETVIEHCHSNLGKHMVPEAVHVIKAMPLNSNGKIVKNELRKLAAADIKDEA